MKKTESPDLKSNTLDRWADSRTFLATKGTRRKLWYERQDGAKWLRGLHS
jgi:hypothetical protein